MLALIKELADRFIEFVLSLVKGETLEAQLTSALKSTMFMLSVLICLVINLLITNMSQRVELRDMEDGISKVNILFDGKNGGSIQGFLKVNTLLTEQNMKLKQENVGLLTHTIRLGSETQNLKAQMILILQENTVLLENNKILIQQLKRQRAQHQ